MPMIDLTLFYYAFIQPHIDYCLSVWGHTSKHNIQMVQRFQNRAARIISHNFDYSVSSSDLIHNLKWQSVNQGKDYLTAILMFKCINNIAPDYLCNEFYKITDVHDRVTRKAQLMIYMLQQLRQLICNAHYVIMGQIYGTESL